MVKADWKLRDRKRVIQARNLRQHLTIYTVKILNLAASLALNINSWYISGDSSERLRIFTEKAMGMLRNGSENKTDADIPNND